MDPDFAKDVAWDKPCEYCQGGKRGNQIVGLSLPYIPGMPDHSADVIAESLEKDGDLRQGKLLRCRHCGRPWLDDGQGFCSVIYKPDIAAVIRWNDHPLAPDAHLPALAKIGATPGLGFRDALRVPCRVRVGSEWLDPCRVGLQNAPPIVAGYYPVIFIDDVTEIEATEFALPLELREHSYDVPETNMGYAPFVVYWGLEEIRLNGIQDLWGEGGMMGSDLSLKPRGPDWLPTALRPRALASQAVTVVIADLNGAARIALTRSSA
jgi:hypothetical protein